MTLHPVTVTNINTLTVISGLLHHIVFDIIFHFDLTTSNSVFVVAFCLEELTVFALYKMCRNYKNSFSPLSASSG